MFLILIILYFLDSLNKKGGVSETIGVTGRPLPGPILELCLSRDVQNQFLLSKLPTPESGVFGVNFVNINLFCSISLIVCICGEVLGHDIESESWSIIL